VVHYTKPDLGLLGVFHSSTTILIMSATEKAQEIQAEDPHANSTAAEIKRSITIDTLHNDEAVKVLANYTGPETWDQKEEKRLVKRIDRRLLPILCTTYGIQYYDKAMLSQAVMNVSFRWCNLPTHHSCRRHYSA